MQAILIPSKLDDDDLQSISQEFEIDKPITILGRVKFTHVSDSLLAVTHKESDDVEDIDYLRIQDMINNTDTEFESFINEDMDLIETALYAREKGYICSWLDGHHTTLMFTNKDLKNHLSTIND